MVGVSLVDVHKLSYLPIWLLFDQGRVQVAAGAPFAVGAGGCCGLACGQVPAMSDARPHRRLRLPRLRPWSCPRGFWTVSQEMGADFAMGPGLLGGFRRGSFAVGSADLGERWRCVVFRAGSACETAQKLQTGSLALKMARLGVCLGLVDAGRHPRMNKASETRRRPEVSKIEINTHIKLTSVSRHYKETAG